MSAFTTLDNANMGTEFDKCILLYLTNPRIGPGTVTIRGTAKYFWDKRQPEIDALKAENERLRRRLGVKMNSSVIPTIED